MASFQAILKEKGKTLNVSEIVIPKIQMMHYKNLKSSKRNFYSQKRIEELADSIELVGMVLQPLIVCKLDMGEYEVLAGHRRLAACIYNVEVNGLKKYEQVPCIEIIAGDLIKEMIEEYKEKGMDAEEAMDVFAEYIIIATNSTARGELTDYEKVMQAARLQIIIPIMHGDEKLKGRALRAEIAKEMNKSNGMIGNYMNIYNNLIPAGMEMLEHGLLGITMAAKICSLEVGAQEELLKQERITDADIQRYKNPTVEEPEAEDEEVLTEEIEYAEEAPKEVEETVNVSETQNTNNAIVQARTDPKVEKEPLAAVETSEKGQEMTTTWQQENSSIPEYSEIVYDKDDVAHLLDVYTGQVNRVIEVSKHETNGQQGNASVLKKSVIIRDALSMYLNQLV